MKKWAAEFVREELGIPGCRALIRLDKEVRRRGELQSYETRYFVTSLDPDAVLASEFQDYISRHWEVENCLHWAKDREYEEDKHVLDGSLGEAWTILTNRAVSQRQFLWRGERPKRAVSEKILPILAEPPKSSASRKLVSGVRGDCLAVTRNFLTPAKSPRKRLPTAAPSPRTEAKMSACPLKCSQIA